jgi:hypothetical protein
MLLVDDHESESYIGRDALVGCSMHAGERRPSGPGFRSDVEGGEVRMQRACGFCDYLSVSLVI